MALVPWRPFEDFGTLRHEMDRLLERFFGGPRVRSDPSAGGHRVRTWRRPKIV